MYVEYLQYSNKVFIDLIDYIKSHSKRPYMILFLSDHGFRLNNMDKNYLYINFSSILLPSGDYKSFYPGLSNVNLFRILFNESFGQQMPVLKDSTVFTKEHRFGPRF